MFNMRVERMSDRCSIIAQHNQQQGFTLIELIVTMVLGLIIFTAALQIFLTSSQSSNSQQASSQIQDNIVFGLSQLDKHVRRANFGAIGGSDTSGFVLSYDTQQGGIVLTAPSATPKPKADIEAGITTSLDGLMLNGGKIDGKLLSRENDSESNMEGLKNDQLTIQYQMPLAGQFDCQGREIPEGFYVIERYFVREYNNRKALACASTNYNYNAITAQTTGIEIKNYTKVDGTTADAKFDGEGSIIIPNVDYFRVLYGITEQGNFAINPENLEMRYTPVGADPKTTFNGKRIVSVQLGLLIASESPISVDDKNAELTFNILDKRKVKVDKKFDGGKRFLRETYESTILIRNGRGR